MIYEVAHKNEAGLQLSDVVAGALYQAVTLTAKNECDPQYARALIPRLYRSRRGWIPGYGVKVMPHLPRAKLAPQQNVMSIEHHASLALALDPGGPSENEIRRANVKRQRLPFSASISRAALAAGRLR